MKKRFIEGELNTHEDHHINSSVMEQASDTAEKLTELECKLNSITCWITERDGLGDTEVSRFSEEAQDIFNEYYDEQMTELYGLLNYQLEIIK